ncbi:hypothetical protein [Pseudomonas syringae]|uniref:hypothetical protein n=1 Tax=Pseudomonas syringae TaxID=317 RepID=UPI001013B506|nr:hypothetical protein [Pseudomonas syringae]RXT70623.1 hypothetical protein B1F71_01935 [Pseudomonas syringae]RXT93430.1 hypothetical protein B1F75_13255 [Pseudomonas syringae]
MTKKSFSDFVNEKKSPSSQKFDPQEQIEEWRKLLDNLYTEVRTFLTPFITEGSTELSLHPIMIREESLGIYQVESAVLRIGNIKYIFSPVGTMLIGSKGRVDIVGPKGTRSVALIKGTGPKVTVTVTIGDETPIRKPQPNSGQEELPWRWVILSAKPPYKYSEWNKENFQELIMDMA